MLNGDGGDERGKRGIDWIQYFPSLESDSYIDETLPEFSHKKCITIMFHFGNMHSSVERFFQIE
jgi:hypothetical protein